MAKKLFLIINENADGVGGDRIVYGENYNELVEHLVDQYHDHLDNYADQITEEEPEVVAYINKLSEKTKCTKRDVTGFDLLAAGVSLSCSELFVGKKGFRALLEHIKSCYFDSEHDVEDSLMLKRLELSYDDDATLNSIFGMINDRIWCA